MKGMPFVETNGINTYYEIHGEGPPLILVEGLRDNLLLWQEIVKGFAKHFKVIIFDIRGTGQTDAPIDNYSIEVFAEDINALMEKLNIENAHFLGHSMGTLIIQQLCLSHPDRVKKAVLCVPLAYFPEISKHSIRTQLKLLEKGLELSSSLEILIPWLFSNEFVRNPRNIEKFIKEALENPYPQTTEGLLGQVDAIFKCDLRNQVKNIPHNLLLLAGGKDILTPPYLAKWINDHAQRSIMHTFSEMGHMICYEIPDRIIKKSLEFFMQK